MIKNVLIGVLCGMLSAASLDIEASQPLTTQKQLEKDITTMLAKSLDQWSQQHIETIKQKIAKLKPTAPGTARTFSEELARLEKQYTAGAEVKKKREATEQKLEQELTDAKRMLDDRIRMGRDSFEKYKSKEEGFRTSLNHLQAEKAMTENTLGALRKNFEDLSKVQQELQKNHVELLKTTQQLQTNYEATIAELRGDIQMGEEQAQFWRNHSQIFQGDADRLQAENSALRAQLSAAPAAPQPSVSTAGGDTKEIKKMEKRLKDQYENQLREKDLEIERLTKAAGQTQPGAGALAPQPSVSTTGVDAEEIKKIETRITKRIKDQYENQLREKDLEIERLKKAEGQAQPVIGTAAPKPDNEKELLNQIASLQHQLSEVTSEKTRITRELQELKLKPLIAQPAPQTVLQSQVETLRKELATAREEIRKLKGAQPAGTGSSSTTGLIEEHEEATLPMPAGQPQEGAVGSGAATGPRGALLEQIRNNPQGNLRPINDNTKPNTTRNNKGKEKEQ